jgi:X-X-X-Leu-X-X-Gly heptad repeat protein
MRRMVTGMKTSKRLAAAAAVVIFALTAACVRAEPGASSGGGGPGSTGSAEAGAVDSKEEVIYGILSADGAVGAVYAVNILNVGAPGLVTDHGEYAAVENLSSTGVITAVDAAVTLYGSGRHYYQGTLASPALPWAFDISFTLDGAPVPPAELAGRSGRLVIALRSSANGGIDPYFTDNYLLQITVKLDTSRCANIVAPGATIANAGRDRVLSYTVMPGADADIRIEFDSTYFEMEGIEISALPFSLESAMPDMSGLDSDLGRLVDAIGELSGGAAALDDGARALKSGAGELASGTESFADGVSRLSGSSAALTEGSAQINGALEAIAGGLAAQELPDFSQLERLTSILQQTAGALIAARDGLTELGGGFELAFTALSNAVNAIPGDEITQRELDGLYAAAPAQKDVIDSLAAYYAAATAAKTAYATALPALEAVAPAVESTAERLNTAAASLIILASQAGAATDADITGQLGQLTEAMTALSEQYAQFHSGLTAYTGGVGELARASRELAGGTRELAGGVGGVSDGASALRGGAEALSGAAAQIPERIDELLGGSPDSEASAGGSPVSFMSPKNENVTLVQFVIRTEKIDVPESPAPTAPAEPEEDKSFKTRFLDLFR